MKYRIKIGINDRDRPFSYSENIELFTVSKRDILNQATIIGRYVQKYLHKTKKLFLKLI